MQLYAWIISFVAFGFLIYPEKALYSRITYIFTIFSSNTFSILNKE